MFHNLSRHNKILVTGPHRSGTTIAAKMIAHDTGHGLVLEELCNFNHAGVTHWLKDVDAPVVIQAPFAADICHQFPGICVVFMLRDLSDIRASRERTKNPGGQEIPWPKIDRAQRTYFNSEAEDVDALKYENWELQKERISYPVEVVYESLRGHPLWIDKPFRKDFHVRQTSAVA